MSGEWLALGVVGLLAAGGLAKRGSRSERNIDPTVLQILSWHPAGGEITAYLHEPTLARWRRVRSAIIPGTEGMGRTLWQAVIWYAWYDQTGAYERPPFEWMRSDPSAYPDHIDAFPPPVVVEKAVLMASGRPVLVQAADQAPLSGGPRTTEPVEAQRFDGLELTLYPGRLPDGGVYWLSKPPTVGIAVFIEPRKSGFNAVWVLRRKQDRHLLTTTDDSGVTRVTGGPGSHEAAAAARRLHGLDLTLDDTHHWSYEGRHLEPGPLPSLEQRR